MQPPESWQAPGAAQRPDLAPPGRPITPPPGFGETPLIQPAGGGKPFWKRWWVIAVAGLLVVAGVVAAVGNQADDDGEVASPTNPDVTEPADEPAEAPADEPVEQPLDEPIETPLDEPADEPAGEPDDEPDDEPAEEPVEEPDDSPMVGTREMPYAIGEPAVITFETFGDADGSVWTLTVDGPGRDITDAVLAGNSFNDAPRDGHVFYGVPVSMTLHEARKQPLSTLFNIDHEFFLPNGLRIVSDVLADGCGVVAGEYSPFKEVFVGGTISGVVCYAVPADEVADGILLTVDELTRDRVFLATVDGVGVESPDVVPAADTAPPDGETAVGSRGNPIAVGTPTPVTLDTLGDADGSRWTLTVDGPGTDITDAVLAENPFNEPPAEGRVFYGVPITFTLDAATKEPLSVLINTDFEFYAPVSLEIVSAGLTEGCGVVPDEFDLFAEVFVGGSVSGVVCYDVSADDAAAGIQLTLDSLEEGRLFFATAG